MARVKLTERLLEALKPTDRPTGKCYYDTEHRGFGVRVFPSGRKVFFIEYGPPQRRRRMRIGPWGALTLDKALKQAKLKLAAEIAGKDPLDEKKKRRGIPTVSAWIDEYLDGVRLRKKRPSEDERYLAFAKQRWGSRPLDSITQRDIEAAMQTQAEKRQAPAKVRQGKTAGHLSKEHRKQKAKTPPAIRTVGGRISANRWLASVRACLAAAWRAGILADNPAMRVRLYKENVPRARVLSDAEMGRLLAALDKLRDQFERAAFRLLLETGARRSEVLRAKWEDLDLGAGTWRIPSPKAGYPQVVPLARSTVTLLHSLPRTGELVIPGRHEPDKPRADLKGPWEQLRKAAKLPDVHLHDLRRTYGLRVAKQAGLHVASKLLRHGDVRITERVYAPLGLDDLRRATEAQAGELAKVLPMVSKGA